MKTASSCAARALLLLAAGLAPALGQTGPAPAPGPVQAAPLPPPGAPAAGASAPSAPLPAPATPAQAPAAAAPAATAPAAGALARPTLLAEPGDPSNADEVVLPERAVIVVSGTSTWEEGLKTLRAAFGRLEAELARSGIAPSGRPLALFTQTTDDTFRFDAMVPVAAIPTPSPSLPPEMRWGTTPSGKAWRFVHKGPYDDIDATYETVTAYLDTKDIVAKDAFLEEYVDDLADPTDPNLELNIFVQPK